MVPEKFGYFPEYREVTGTPREKLWALWAIRGKHSSPQGARAPPPLGRRLIRTRRRRKEREREKERGGGGGGAAPS